MKIPISYFCRGEAPSWSYIIWNNKLSYRKYTHKNMHNLEEWLMNIFQKVEH